MTAIRRPVLLFDTDDYLYILDDAGDVDGWLEPFADEETAAAFDSRGHPLAVVAGGRSYRLEAVGPAEGEQALRAHVAAFLEQHHPAEREVAHLPLPAMLARLVKLT